MAVKWVRSGWRGVIGTLAVLLGTPILLAGCGASADEATSAGPPSDAPMVAEKGPFLQMCGGVEDTEFLQATGLPSDAKVFRNAVGCQWDAAVGAEHGSFTWYRGSPIDREYTIVDTAGRTVRTVSIDGHDGYEGKTSDGSLCEVGVRLGDDFFVWSIVLPPTMGRDTCAVAAELATMTLERAQ